MTYLHGKVICGGTALGTAYVFHRNAGQVKECKTACPADEQHRLENAVEAVKEELTGCAQQAKSDTAKEIFEIHRMMLEDDDVLDFLHNAVENDGLTAQKAVFQAEQYFSQLFRDTPDDYMIARIDDIRDVCGRLTAYLSDEKYADKPHEPFILAANELLPADLMRFGAENMKGIVLGSGSVYSHASIMIKEMGIPALICENINEIKTGMSVLLDADGGTAYLEPDEETVRRFSCFKQSAVSNPFEGLPCKIYVNIANPSEVSGELLKKCDGIGLFRTEYLYFGRTDPPGEDEQFAIYKEILEKADGKNVTVRTFDTGSDKAAECLPLEKEENPALGFRGLRVYSLYPEVFKTQLRALLRAAVYGNLRIMYPMVTSCSETEEIRRIILQTAHELSEQGIPYKIPLQGAMIETPAAALLSGKLAQTVDFFSVGTNDLVQYTLALDRQSGRLDSFNDKSYEAVTALIKTAAENARKNGIEIGICGELASQPELTGKWLEAGIDYLSVSPAALKK
ncbi:MAG: phosphoenolpyruvate--protein phosphotransferase [Clostridia bacterium]|nr:phosphoenolpyruvate--protein phosphotransferase [Clostridia bacterium]